MLSEWQFSSLTVRSNNIWVHLEHPGLPRITNIIEGIIRQLSRKLDDTAASIIRKPHGIRSSYSSCGTASRSSAAAG